MITYAGYKWTEVCGWVQEAAGEVQTEARDQVSLQAVLLVFNIWMCAIALAHQGGPRHDYTDHHAIPPKRG